MYCSRFYKKESEDKCAECLKQFKSIFERVRKQYAVVLKDVESLKC